MANKPLKSLNFGGADTYYPAPSMMKGVVTAGNGAAYTVTIPGLDAIAALKIGDYAKAADLTALAGRVSALETGKADKATTLAGYGIADAYTKTEADAKIVELIDANVTINVATDDEVTAVCTAVFGA